MKGILFKEDLFHAVVAGIKTETRRIAIREKPRYNVGEKVFLKEPYLFNSEDVFYKFDNLNGTNDVVWNNKMFMPAKYARYYIEITEVRSELLHDISEESAIAEGVERDGLGWKSYDKIPTGPHKGEEHPFNAIPYRHAVYSFKSLWERINGVALWEANPKVLVYKFKLVK